MNKAKKFRRWLRGLIRFLDEEFERVREDKPGLDLPFRRGERMGLVGCLDKFEEIFKEELK